MIQGNIRPALLILSLLLWRPSLSAEPGSPPFANPAFHGASMIYSEQQKGFLHSCPDSFPPVLSEVSPSLSRMWDTVLVVPGSSNRTAVHVYMPQQRKPGILRYPVLYLPLPEAWSGGQGCMDSILSGCCSQSICVTFTWSDTLVRTNTAGADSNASSLARFLKSVIDKRYPTCQEPRHTSLAAFGQSGYPPLRLMLLNPDIFGNGILFLGNEGVSSEEQGLLQRHAPAFSGKFCFYLCGDLAAFDETSWLDKFGLMSTAIIYAARVPSGPSGSCFWKTHFASAYAWLMADGPNKIVNSGD